MSLFAISNLMLVQNSDSTSHLSDHLTGPEMKKRPATEKWQQVNTQRGVVCYLVSMHLHKGEHAACQPPEGSRIARF